MKEFMWNLGDNRVLVGMAESLEWLQQSYGELLPTTPPDLTADVEEIEGGHHNGETQLYRLVRNTP